MGYPCSVRVLAINPTIDKDLELYHLGTAGIATFANHVGRHSAQVCDFTFFWDEWESYLRGRLERQRPHVVAISTVTPRMPSVLRIARAVRAFDPRIRIVLGGHHASLDTRGTIRRAEVDYVVVGEGEHVFHALLDALEDCEGRASELPDRLRAIPSLAWIGDDNEIVETPLGPLPRGAVLDALPPNDWRLWEQHGRMIYHAGFVPIIGVRGCPYECSFCSSPVLAKRLETAGPFVRKRSARAVAEECAVHLERHRHQGLRYMNFYDQNFLMHKSWLEEFCTAYRELGLHTKLPFSVYSRVDHLTPDRIELARSAGCVQLRLGIESGDAYVRNSLLNKELDQATLCDKLDMVRRSGIKTLGYFLIGTPGETPVQAQATWDFARTSGLDRAAFFFFTPLWNLEVMKDSGVDVNYLERDESATFYQGQLTEEVSGLGKARLKALFFRANGYYLARTIGRQVRAQGPRWVAGLPGYWREARKDGMDLKLALSQYVYYHGDSYRI